jgi:hypothetical protein
MKFYIKLQIRRMKRMLADLGIKPYLGLFLAIIIFISFSKYLFYKISYAELIYVFIGISTIFKLGERNRNDNLISIFKKKTYYQIRILENSVLAFPFLVYLLYERSYLMILVLSILSILIAPLNIKQNLNFTIPTPFQRFPFEFIVGFRKAFFLYLFSYFLCFKAIQVGNFNLGLFSLGTVYLISMLFFSKPENSYFVWIYSVNSKTFLLKKIFSSFICSSLIAIPNFVVLLFFFKTNYLLIAGVVIFGLILLISVILAKYSAFPNEMNLHQSLLYGISLWVPPLFLITIPFFYIQSRRSLEPILE